MGVSEKYGFGFSLADADSPAVRFYVDDHWQRYGYPPDVKPASEYWIGVCRDDHVWAVFGAKSLSGSVVEIPDFFIHRSRWGVLAGYAALEQIKSLADQTGVSVVTVTPMWNTRQQKAQEKAFGVEATDKVYWYRPENK